MNLYDVDTKILMIDLIEEIRSEHPELSKKAARLLLLNALLGNVVREEISNQVNFLIENGGWSQKDEEDVA